MQKGILQNGDTKTSMIKTSSLPFTKSLQTNDLFSRSPSSYKLEEFLGQQCQHIPTHILWGNITDLKQRGFPDLPPKSTAILTWKNLRVWLIQSKGWMTKMKVQRCKWVCQWQFHMAKCLGWVKIYIIRLCIQWNMYENTGQLLGFSWDHDWCRISATNSRYKDL